MKRFMMIVGLAMMMLVVSACGGNADTSDTSSTTNNGNTQNTSAEANVTVTISGAIENSIEDNGRLYCSEEAVTIGGIPYLEITAGSFSGNDIQIRLPYNITSGTYDMIGQDGESAENPSYGLSPEENMAKIRYQDENRDDWQFGTGSITLEAVPTADGEPIVGSFTATLMSDDVEGEITLEGEFDYTASSSAFTDGDDGFADDFTEVPCD